MKHLIIQDKAPMRTLTKSSFQADNRSVTMWSLTAEGHLTKATSERPDLTDPLHLLMRGSLCAMHVLWCN